jgi:hypothetical protein
MVLGSATAVALSRSPSPGELAVPPQPAVASTTVAPSTVTPAPVEPEVPTTTPSSDPAPPDVGSDYPYPIGRCRAAVASSGRADEYPDVAGWTVTEELPTRGIDRLLAINNAFLCYVSPTRVWVSSTTGVEANGVQVVKAGPDLFGLLNPHGLGVSWGIETSNSALSSEPSTAAVQAIDLANVVATNVNVGVRDVGGQYYLERLPETAPDPIVVVDRPMPTRDSATVDGAALDACVRPRPTDPNETAGLMNPLTRTVAGESEPELWQPLARIDLPDGGFALSARIGEGYSGVCLRTGDGWFWSGTDIRHLDYPADPAVAVNGLGPRDGAPTRVWLILLADDVDRVEMTTDGGVAVPCEVRAGQALCAGGTTGQVTLTCFDASGTVLGRAEF